MQTEQQLRDLEIETAYQYLRQKDWERMNNRRELKSLLATALLMIVAVGATVAATNIILFGSL
jgi:hypothetical protein